MNKEIIKINNLWFSYFNANDGPFALKDVSLSIERGEFIAIIGQNGSGKTTIAKHLNGILKPSKGEVIIGGIESRSQSTSILARIVGYCYQNPDHQIFSDTVLKELEFGPRNMELSKEEISKRVHYAINTVGLSDFADVYPFNMGKGQRQKLAVASVLATQPEMMVVDEPTTGLDWIGSEAIMNLLVELNEKGHTIAFITHDIRIVARYAKRVIVMGDGKIVGDSKFADIKTIMTDDNVLSSGHLRPLQSTRIARRLSNWGISPKVLTSDELHNEIMTIVKGK